MNVNSKQFKNITTMCRIMRLRVLELTYGVGRSGTHLGAGLSVIEILSILYCNKLNITKNNLHDKHRDRFILSKGHSAIALFTALEYQGFIKRERLDTFEKNGAPYYAHAKRNLSEGIEFSGGSLSLGLSFGVGVALSCKMDSLTNHVYVLVGDGECDEGLVWESLMSASHFNLTNLTLIVDFNNLQSDGYTKDIMDKSTLGSKIESFGFNVCEIDGHDLIELDKSFLSRDFSKPNAIIAHTIKGKGVSFMENSVDWHHGSLTLEQYNLAVSEQI
jgi:transketolase